MNLQNILVTQLSEIKILSLGQSIKELGLKSNIVLDGTHCTITCTAGFPIKTLANELKQTIQEELQNQFPDMQLTIQLDSFIQAHRTQLPGKGLRGIKNTIAIASGKGGVGKSTVTVNLALALAKAGAKVGILDADIYGPSIPMMLGDCKPVTVQDERYLPAEAHGIQAMSIGYLTDPEQALIWRGPMLAKSLLQMLDITRWDNLDYLLIDLPPGTGDIQLSLVQKIPLTAAIVVTTPQNIATLDAQKAIKLFERTQIQVLGLIENMALHTCRQCQHQEAIFGEGGASQLCKQFQLPLLGQLPLHQDIRRFGDEGQSIVERLESREAKPWIEAAMYAAITLAQKPINYSDKFPPIIQIA